MCRDIEGRGHIYIYHHRRSLSSCVKKILFDLLLTSGETRRSARERERETGERSQKGGGGTHACASHPRQRPFHLGEGGCVMRAMVERAKEKDGTKEEAGGTVG